MGKRVRETIFDPWETEEMLIWLRSVVDAILGRVPGKTSRLDTATRMAMDEDFSHRLKRIPPVLPRERERDDRHDANADLWIVRHVARRLIGLRIPTYRLIRRGCRRFGLA